MDNQTINELAQFCADQYFRLDPEQWLQMTRQHRHVSLALAKYLSGTSWYDHSEQLEHISELARFRNLDHAETGSAQEAVDIALFSAIIRMRIAQRRTQGNAGAGVPGREIE